MKEKSGKDATGRTMFELIDCPGIQYSLICDMVMDRFGMIQENFLTEGLDEVFQDFRLGKSIIGIEWDNWLGLCIVAKTSCANDLVHKIGTFLEQSEVYTVKDQKSIE